MNANATHYEVRQGRRTARKEWLTPPALLAALGPFDLDPCAAVGQPFDTAAHMLTVEDRGDLAIWRGRVWLNPPFGPTLPMWVERMARHGNGVMLMPLRSTSTKWFHACVWNRASAILFCRGRISFWNVDGTEGAQAPHDSMLVTYGATNARALRRAMAAGSCAPECIRTGKLIDLGLKSRRRARSPAP